MRKIVVLTFLSLDGVMQAPGGPEEDTSDGFKYGGWSFPYADEISRAAIAEQIKPPFDLLLGRKTYDIFKDYWPKVDGKNNSIAAAFSEAKKYVVSNSSIDLGWEESILITGDDVASKIKDLKNQEGPMLQVHGSSNLIQTLLKNDLVDELWLKIYPITLGSGKRLFGEGTITAGFSLIKSETTSNGVIIASYKRDGEVKTGSFD